jgi:hypothetical protein
MKKIAVPILKIVRADISGDITTVGRIFNLDHLCAEIS